MSNKGASFLPRGLQQKDAAAYAGLSVTSFMKHVETGWMPMPHRIGSELVWDRTDIDRVFDALSAQLRTAEAWEAFIRTILKDAPSAAQQPQRGATKPVRPRTPGKRGPNIKTLYQLKDGEWQKLSEEEREMVRKKTAAVDAREVRSEPLNRLEKIALWELYRRRGQMLDAHVMRGITFRTHNRLRARRYVNVRVDEHDNVKSWEINDRGIAAVKDIPEQPAPAYRLVK